MSTEFRLGAAFSHVDWTIRKPPVATASDGSLPLSATTYPLNRWITLCGSAGERTEALDYRLILIDWRRNRL
jgi:hypothetical protein